MYTLSLLACFGSVFCHYAIAQKTDITKTGLTLRLSQSRLWATLAAIVSGLIMTAALIALEGPMTGIFTSMVLWMIGASLMLLFRPFQKVQLWHILVFGGVFCLIEYCLIVW
ncbi:MAG: hypothetical protein AAF960_10310 [Bacteroidota bacterium]